MTTSTPLLSQALEDESTPFDWHLDSIANSLDSMERTLKILIEATSGPIGEKLCNLQNRLEPVRDRLDTLRDDSFDLDAESASFDRQSRALEKKLKALDQKVDRLNEELDALQEQEHEESMARNAASAPKTFYQRVQNQYDMGIMFGFSGLAYRWLFILLIHLPLMMLTIALLAWLRTWTLFEDDWLSPFVLASFIYFKTDDFIAPWLCWFLLPRWPSRPNPPTSSA